MSRAPSTFRQRDVTAALKAVTAAGCPVARVEIDKEGKIIIIMGKPADQQAAGVMNEWDSTS